MDMQKEPTMALEANPTTGTKSTLGKLVQFELNTAAVADLASDFLKPEKLSPILQEHKSPSSPNQQPLTLVPCGTDKSINALQAES